ncbi:MAG TPA: tRNA (adenosine(37)-N6)-threonylcarbamoyltransferase complex dimerization subunit type 1 TsaB [Isosphaeraceae bacterium]|nr:tRNA (adenosine(37)-N6)-threonylcarbamoyltransferase complex dimerization subunit type 1 TsaB [Isosphaeraceae bacterium]
MNLLALDTSTERAAIALGVATGQVYEATTAASRRHGRDLIPRVSALLAEGGLRAFDLDIVAVGLGPGSYTGLRVGVTAAKTLAYVTGAVLLGLDSLQAVGRNAPPEVLRVTVLGDAQRGDVAVAELFRPAAGAPLRPLGESRLEPLAAWLDRLEPGIFVLGPGLESPRIRAAMPAGLATGDPALNSPQGRHLLAMAREVFDSGQRENPWLIEPRYLRRSAAEEQWTGSPASHD